jgi:GNAT superfamily N-acetyltransferase
MPSAIDIARARRFNRAVTAEAGALDSSFLGRGRPLGEARVLFGIGTEGKSLTDLRISIGIDAGLLSRLLGSLQAQGLVTVTSDESDGRRRVARTTPAGVAEIAAYDRLNNTRVARLLSAQGRRAGDLLDAMDLIANALNRDRITIARADPDAPEARACLAAYARLLAEKIAGFDAGYVPTPDPEAWAYRPPRGAFLLAHSDGPVTGCVSVKTAGPGLGEAKRLWVAPSARGMGLARRLMTAIEAEARSLGLTRLRLDTNENLPEAIALYRNTGWTPAAPFSAFPATHWFEKPL